jgi:hypothetical protein
MAVVPVLAVRVLRLLVVVAGVAERRQRVVLAELVLEAVVFQTRPAQQDVTEYLEAARVARRATMLRLVEMLNMVVAAAAGHQVMRAKE